MKVLKDLNFIELQEGLGAVKGKEEMLKAIEEDAMFLAKQNLMDYSLLLVKVEIHASEIFKEMPAMVMKKDTKGENELMLEFMLEDSPGRKLSRSVKHGDRDEEMDINNSLAS
mmetsp:Transcript_42966/g.31371  ORF Transcript_42966/g.31371 Transcript_42966/m.31371 type:complete len:113 (-) Transcript_42966:401-739(-)|eukprot:CAMPEP_0202967658 /NCGR_PEP_ID=MMETSP1396-20130829/12622_1 /ASSEMBLY_ACC=CAM_ASM_000872 /TAXON_ID= /ORGANISM="Pseudokeronopsis sp., Strain Brazil" /LENGTH=112 /DNA_ID=CAMNT_0049692983 /DNA_START=873 /DNA_END=1211 /DNA_ORIENTATION=+